jgi:hypothetical protein
MTMIFTTSPISKILLPVFLFILSASSFAQKSPDIQKIYADFSAGGVSNKGAFASAGVQAVWKNDWVTTFSYHSIDMQPKNLPSDYERGYSVFLFIPIPSAMPNVDMNIYSLTAGRYIKSGKNTWFTTNAGLSLVNANQLKFSRRMDDPSWTFGFVGEEASNYTYSEEKKTSLGAMVNADFNWAFASFAGLGAGVFTNLNSIQSPVGFSIKLIVGKTGWEKRNKS